MGEYTEEGERVKEARSKKRAREEEKKSWTETANGQAHKKTFLISSRKTYGNPQSKDTDSYFPKYLLSRSPDQKCGGGGGASKQEKYQQRRIKKRRREKERDEGRGGEVKKIKRREKTRRIKERFEIYKRIF